MDKLDIEGIVRQALERKEDPHLSVMEEMNKRNLERDEPLWEKEDRSMVKMFVMGFLYAKDLELDGENWYLKEVSE